MNYLKLILLTIVLPFSLQAQNLKGKYICGKEYFSFSNDSVFFHLFSGGGVVTEFEAVGIYKIQDNKLIIDPLINNTKEIIEKTARYKNDSLKIEIATVDNAFRYSSVIFYNKEGKVIVGQIVDRNNTVYLSKKILEQADSVKINAANYISVSLKLEKQFDYKIVLQQGKTKMQYEDLLNSKTGGLEIKIGYTEIQIRRLNFNKRIPQYFWQSYRLE